jgi:hypothetical protein
LKKSYKTKLKKKFEKNHYYKLQIVGGVGWGGEGRRGAQPVPTLAMNPDF